MKYHVNKKGEAGECGATKGNCPFGSESEHFTSPEAARSAYEERQAGVLKGSRKSKQVEGPRTQTAFLAGIANVPDVENSKVIAAPAVVDNRGYMGGRRYIGRKTNEATGYVGQAEASEGLKDLIRHAHASGELPQWLTVAVRKNNGANVTSIAVVAGYKPEGERRVRAIPDEWLYEPQSDEDKAQFRRAQLRPPVKKLETYLQTLSKEYENSDINGMVDYYQTSNAGDFHWRRSWEDKD